MFLQSACNVEYSTQQQSNQCSPPPLPPPVVDSNLSQSFELTDDEQLPDEGGATPVTIQPNSETTDTQQHQHKQASVNPQQRGASKKSDEPKPAHSYIGLIALAILSTPEKRLVLSDIYQWILDNYVYFRQHSSGWRNSIRHNLSLNDCFMKTGRSANGKGHYWTIPPANMTDFVRGDFRRRRAQRRVRRSLGLAVPDEDDDDDDEEEQDADILLTPPSSLSPVPSKILKTPKSLVNGVNDLDKSSDSTHPVCTQGAVPKIVCKRRMSSENYERYVQKTT